MVLMFAVLEAVHAEAACRVGLAVPVCERVKGNIMSYHTRTSRTLSLRWSLIRKKTSIKITISRNSAYTNYFS